jgi:hypothetical protein
MGFKCPWGHQSTNDEYCDFCGALNPMARQVVRGPTSRSASGVAVVEQPCRVCGTGRDGTDRYCANCGYDFEVGEPLPADLQAHWEALPTAPPNGGPELPAVAESSTPPAAAPSITPPAPSPPPPTDAPTSSAALVLQVGVNTQRFQEPDCPPPPADLSERVFMVDRSPILIGRDGPGLHIPIHGDPYVSRRHAEIVWIGAGWGVRDLGSTNGTRLNGVPVEGSEIRSFGADDVIEVGFFTQLKVRGLT